MKKNCTIQSLVALFVLHCLVATCVFAQSKVELNPISKSVVPFVSAQLWNTASFDNTVDSETSEDRYSSYFRRLRIGLKGYPIDRLYYNIMLCGDYLGKDNLVSSKGSANGSTIKLWSAYFSYKLTANNDILHITSGYMLPHMSRESTTSPWAISSLDKSESSCYLRRFATGKSNGICTGINIGGLAKADNVSFYYNVAILNNKNNGSNQGQSYTPLFIGHAIVTLGDAEFKKYKYTMAGNTLDQKTSISLGAGFSTQNECDFYQSNTTWSADAKIRFKGFHTLLEYSAMDRTTNDDVSFSATTLLFRSGFNFMLKKSILEPCVSYRSYKGDDNGSAIGFYSGEDNQLDVGVNWWISGKNLKLNLHYLESDGNGDNFSIKESSDSYRGNLIALGMQIVL